VTWRTERLLLAGFLLAASSAWGQVTNCTASSLSMSLGVYEGGQATPADSSANFTVSCSRTGGPGNHTVWVMLGPSVHSGAVATRMLRLVGGSDTVTYNIYRDAGRNLVWGNTPATGMSLTQDIKNNTTMPWVFTFFGRIDAMQDVRPGSYADTLTITVTF
jgi:spore coat protein U-like protein